MTVTTTHHAPHRLRTALIGTTLAMGLVLLLALLLSSAGSAGSGAPEAPAIAPVVERDAGCGLPAPLAEAERTTMQELCRAPVGADQPRGNYR